MKIDSEKKRKSITEWQIKKEQHEKEKEEENRKKNDERKKIEDEVALMKTKKKEEKEEKKKREEDSQSEIVISTFNVSPNTMKNNPFLQKIEENIQKGKECEEKMKIDSEKKRKSIAEWEIKKEIKGKLIYK